MIKEFEISGLRGFASKQTLKLAVPNGRAGSGITVLVGPNNGGKSTIIEGWKALASPEPRSFTVSHRNHSTNDRVSIAATDDRNAVFRLQTVAAGGSETTWEKPAGENLDIFTLPSRRFFTPFFGRSNQERHNYIAIEGGISRGEALNSFSGRLFRIHKNRGSFDDLLSKVIDPLPTWTIDQAEGGYFLRFETQGTHHSSEGLGEGLVSLFFIIDALYDATEGSVVVIDEPELSLHPSFQRKLAALFAEFAKSKQLLIATHSPYFVDFNNVVSGSQVARVHLSSEGSTINALSEETVRGLEGFLNNLSNPHILGIEAREVFFLADRVILVEGQEDVICYRQIAAQLEKTFAGEFFGWGVGGAHNMEAIASLLRDLGFAKVVGILDGNKQELIKPLQDKFPEYSFFGIPADDVRTKPARDAQPLINGLLDANRLLKKDYAPTLSKLFDDIGQFFSRKS